MTSDGAGCPNGSPEPELQELVAGVLIKSDAPLFCSANDIDELGGIAAEWKKAVDAATAERQIVLETWLLVDYLVRLLLDGALNVGRFSTKDFDLRYQLLPQSHDRCLSLLQRLHSEHSKLPESKPTSAVTMLAGFAEHLLRHDRALFDKLIEADRAYIQRHFGLGGISATSTSKLTFDILKRTPERLSNHWLEAVDRLDDAWFEAARKLNKARNEAAHSTSRERIAGALGICGPKTIEPTRCKCKEIVERLFGLVQCSSDIG
jgi:hypothetical protein